MGGDSMVSARIDQLADKLRRVVQQGLALDCEGHEFVLYPPLSEQQVADFESRYRVQLPAGYRTFITQVANGEAGPPVSGMFPLERTLPAGLGEIPEDFLSRPFPHVEYYNPNDDGKEQAFSLQWEKGKVTEDDLNRHFLYRHSGTLNLCHEGCGHYHFLVVTGPTRGQMWIDSCGSDGGYFPLKVEFLDWYERWLDDILVGGNGVWWFEENGQSSS